ncbi:MAG: hypothetical protein ABFS09_12425 [Thermodesulfobacteriota bacterium]
MEKAALHNDEPWPVPGEKLSEEQPIFSSRPDTLSFEQATYYQDLLYRTIKIGTELEFALPKKVKREIVEERLISALKPSQDMNNLGRLGVFDITKEHCGIEIRVIGRHPHWDAQIDQYRQIIAPLWANQVRMRPTCGLHFHLLGVGLSEPVPEIILANFWNIMRRYAPGLKFLTSGGENLKCLCRRRQHNAHQEFMAQSPELHPLSKIQHILKESFEVPEHQNFFNIEHVRFNDKGQISTFHVEFRFPDGDLSPLSITAKVFLFLVMMLKAVEISKFGLLHVGKTGQWQRKNKLLDLISNNDGKLATSDTSQCEPFLDEYQHNAQSLLRFLKSIFVLIDNPAEIVLQALAEEPISLRRHQGMSWQDIDEELQSLVGPRDQMDELDYQLCKIIELGLVEEKDDYHSWLVATAHLSNCPVDEVLNRLAKYKKRKPLWSPKLGRMVFFR